MQTHTELWETMTIAEAKATYDTTFKHILANKEILANIMKSCLEEYKDCTIEDIATLYIEKEPEISSVLVNPGMTNWEESESVAGLNTEDKVSGEGEISYDIRFYASAPKNNETIKLIINIEAQNDYYPGYPLLKRGMFYCARMLSAQYGKEFINSHYENLKKVYSIWICSDPPKKWRNTITQYEMAEKFIVGQSSHERENYDLLSIIMIHLNPDYEKAPQKLLALLDIIISEKLSVRQKAEFMQNHYGITMTRNLEGDVSLMCNVSEGLWKRALTKGIEQGKILGVVEFCRNMGMNNDEIIQNLTKQFSITADEAEMYFTQATAEA